MQPRGVPYGPFFTATFTFTADAARALAEALGQDADFALTDATVQVKTNAALLGDKNGQSLEVAAGNSASFDFIPFSEVWMKNKGAGLNAVVVVSGFTASAKQVRAASLGA